MAELKVEGFERPVALKISPQARRIILRVRPDDRRIEVTIPPWTSKRAAAEFAANNRGWIERRLQLLPQPVPFAPGASIPFQGIEHRVLPTGSIRGRIVRDNGVLHVPGGPEHLARRVAEYLRAEARSIIGERVRLKAGILGLPVRAISLRDTTSRWGSCSPTGALSFSWRLVLAPDWVLDYVVAHEVAHLRHLNHGARFWALTAKLTDSDVERARGWLSNHGPDLLRYGQQACE